jgi:hypothetical protein
MRTLTRAPAPTVTPRPPARGSGTGPDAVLALQRMAGNRATRSLMRQPTTTADAPAPAKAPTIGTSSMRGDVVTVQMSDGTRWKVTRKRSTVPIVKKRGMPGVSVGADFDKVWLKVSWCRGTRGEIRIGGNPQGAAKDVLTELGKSIANGGGAAEARDAIAGAEIEPFIDWDIQRPGEWKISGEVTLTLDKEGVKSAGGKLKVEKGDFEGSLGGKGDRDGGVTITVEGKWTPGNPKKKEECPADELYFPYEYECELERDIPATKRPVKKTRDDKFPEHRFVYFKYASDEINPKLTTKADLDALESLMASGYKVTNVQAFTSPEGLRDPSPKWKEGNKALSKRRADAAMHVAAEHCLEGGCITGDVSEPKDVELLGHDWENLDNTTSEAEGKALEDHVIQMWETDPDVAEQKTPAAEKRVAAARGRKAKAEVIYEYLRRARIDLVRTEHHEWVEDEIVPGRTEITKGNCPKDVLQAAQSLWRIDTLVR